MRWTPACIAAALLGAPMILGGPAGAAIVKIADISATSTLPDDDGASYKESNLKDGRVSTVWVEGDTNGSGLGTSVTVDLGGERMVTGLKIWNGNWYTWDFWQRHNRVKELEVSFEDGTSQTFNLADQMKPETLTFTKPVKASSVRLRIKSIHRGNTFNDTVLSEVQILDNAPSDVISVQGYKASSTYPSDGDGSYEPVNVADGILDSMWCEGNKAGDGTSEWLEFDFGGSRAVSKLKLVNGNALSLGMFMKVNHARKATLRFSDGSTETVDIKPVMMEQTISFPSRQASSVRVTFTEIGKGKEFNDLCISEAAFLP